MGDLMSTVKANDLQNASGGIPTVKGQRLIPTAWVNFNGTGTVVIRDSENVSSITDNNVGDYTLNFATAMADANYCWSWGVKDGATTGRGRFMCLTDSAVISTTQFQSMWQNDDSNVMQDVTSACLTFLGGQA